MGIFTRLFLGDDLSKGVDRNFSPEIERILKKDGWYKRRHINIDDDIKKLEQKGYIITENFKNFYAEFAYLNYDLKVEGKERFIEFDIDTPIQYDYDEVIIKDIPKVIKQYKLGLGNNKEIKEDDERIKCENGIIPVGNIDHSSYLLIDEDNAIYAMQDGLISLEGKSIEEALTNLFTIPWRDNNFIELPTPQWWW